MFFFFLLNNETKTLQHNPETPSNNVIYDLRETSDVLSYKRFRKKRQRKKKSSRKSLGRERKKKKLIAG